MIKKAIKKVADKTISKVAGSYLRQIEENTKNIDALIQKNQEYENGIVGDVMKLRKLVEQVEPYQPIYGLPNLVDAHRKESRDRCDAIYNSFGSDIEGIRFLDIGSSLGYVSFYLADRGAKVEGWDFHDKNVEVSLSAQRLNGVSNAKFVVKKLDENTLQTIQQNSFDSIVMLSVLHHIIYDNGVDKTKKMVAELLERAPMIIAELARKGEDKKLWWDEAQPEHELDIFYGLDVNIELLGEFTNHLSSNTRPLYKITKKSITVNGNIYPTDEGIRYDPYEGAKIRKTEYVRRYYFSNKYFIKEYVYSGRVDNQNTSQVINEVAMLNHLKKQRVKNIPEVVDFEFGKHASRIVFKNIDGLVFNQENHAEFVKHGIKNVVNDILKVLKDLEAEGIYHNDLRSWNVILSDGKVKLIDFGLSSSVPEESNSIALLWMINAFITGQKEKPDYNKNKLPLQKNFEGTEFIKIYKMIKEQKNIKFKDIKASE